MRVLLIVEDGGVPGGHVVQANQTAIALRAEGADVELASPGMHAFSRFDVVHSFGAPRETLRAARRSGAAIVISPIWWSASYVTGQAARPRRYRRLVMTARLGASAMVRGAHETARGLRRRLEEAALSFELADALLPNSHLEAEQIRLDTGVTTPMFVVPNGVDDQLFVPPDRSHRRAGVLCVGRVEPHKNQLGLIRELRGLDVRLAIVGLTHPHHVSYARQCQQAAGDKVVFTGAVSTEVLLDQYVGAAVHVLPSWFESTGLASLEAAAMGCSVVTTNRGYAREYFGDLAIYCDPGRKGSIRRAVEEALSTRVGPELSQQVLRTYTWRHSAIATLAAYKSALGSRP